jgi:catechol 2,3-dioxygenase
MNEQNFGCARRPVDVSMMAGYESRRKDSAMAAQRAIQGLGEIALQVGDLDTMTRFYAEVVNLELMSRRGTANFFRIADGVAGHTQILALFDRASVPGYHASAPATRRAPLDHIAFAIAPQDFAAEQQRLTSLGCEVSLSIHHWVGWRSMYVQDPEGNQVEWVCYEEELLDADA